MKLHVDENLCQGHGRCYAVAPDLLEPDDEGFVTIKGSSIDVPAGQEEFAHRARNACPEDAITVSD